MVNERIEAPTKMNAHVCVECRAAVERFAAFLALMRFVVRMNDFVPAQCRRLSKALTAYL